MFSLPAPGIPRCMGKRILVGTFSGAVPGGVFGAGRGDPVGLGGLIASFACFLNVAARV